MKLRPSHALALVVLGAVAGLIGDHGHVVTGTTRYFTHAVPFVWSSPFWFPLLVGLATASLAEVRLHLPHPRVTVTAKQGIGGVAAVVGTYVVTALVHTAPPVPAVALVVALAVITWCVLGDRASIVCGVLAAVLGPIAEVVLVEIGVFAYDDNCNALFGVGIWLPPLYFAFGVVSALLGELAAKPATA